MTASALKGDVMSKELGDHTGGFNKKLRGVCHRCGWSGTVAKVKRRERSLLNVGHEYGRLCEDCIKDLLDSQPGQDDRTTAPRTLRVIGRRDVA
jgi:hypothetical protein